MKKVQENPVGVPETAPQVMMPPTVIDYSVPGAPRNVAVFDRGTGEQIEKVIFADAASGKVVRYAVEDGNLVRDGDDFARIEEDRAICIEWIEAPIA